MSGRIKELIERDPVAAKSNYQGIVVKNLDDIIEGAGLTSEYLFSWRRAPTFDWNKYDSLDVAGKLEYVIDARVRLLKEHGINVSIGGDGSVTYQDSGKRKLQFAENE